MSFSSPWALTMWAHEGHDQHEIESQSNFTNLLRVNPALITFLNHGAEGREPGCCMPGEYYDPAYRAANQPRNDRKLHADRSRAMPDAWLQTHDASCSPRPIQAPSPGSNQEPGLGRLRSCDFLPSNLSRHVPGGIICPKPTHLRRVRVFFFFLKAELYTR